MFGTGQSPGGRRRLRPGRACRGQVLIIVLLGITLLGGLVFYVVNVGDLADRRVTMQSAADAAAVSGAAWMARSMNVIAMNNVAQTRALALVPILDSFPLATKMAYEEVLAWVDALNSQLQRGVPDAYIRDGLQSLHDRMARQRDILAPMNELFNDSDFHVSELTQWAIRGHAGPPPHGRLWQAADALDNLSQATWASAAVLAQANAVRYGRANEADVAFIVPIAPQLPAVRASFNEFEKPVKKGIIPDRAYPQRLGPYDRLFKWRDYRYRNIYQRDRWVPGRPGHGPIRGGRGNVNISGRRRGRSARGHSSNPNGHWSHRAVGRILMGYTVYGPYTWMLRRISGYAQGWWSQSPGELADTFFHEYQRKIADIKLGYMWGSQNPRFIHYPQWIADYNRARQLAATNETLINRTMFYLVEVRSRYPKNAPGWLSPGSYVTNGKLPIAMWIKGWKDPEKWKVPRIAEWIWEDQYNYETTEDVDIGIRMQRDPKTGQPLWQPVYMVATYVFGGIDVGGQIEVTNPANYSDRSELPAPVLLDTSVGDYDVSQPDHDLGVRREVFTYLGVAKKHNTPLVWGGRFGSGSPYPGIVALAQAEIFNTTSWDLWTQDWKAQLVPMTGYDQWVARMAAGIADAPATGGMVSAAAVAEIQEYLSRFDPELVGEMNQH